MFETELDSNVTENLKVMYWFNIKIRKIVRGNA